MTAIFEHSPERAGRLQNFKRTKDHCAGVDRIKNAREVYLPRHSDMTNADYKRYLDAVVYFPGAAQTLKMFTGLVFRKEYDLRAPNSLLAIRDVVTTDGKTLEQSLRWAFREFAQTRDGGYLVTHPEVPQGASLADVFEQDLRPFLAPFSAESILEVSYGVRGGRKVLKRVRLREDDKTVLDLRLVRGAYIIEKHVETTGGWLPVETSQPLMDGKPMSYIPFVWFGDGEDVSAFDDVAALNQTHYMASAELATAMIWLSRPKLVVKGIKDDVQLSMGINSLWRFEDIDVSVEYLEFKASGLSLLENAVKKAVDALGIMGSRMLAVEEKAAAEAVETVLRRQTGENANLAGMARHISNCATEALKIVALWMGADPATVLLTLNTDFVPQPIDPALLGQVIALYQAGRIPNETLFQILRDGEIIPEGLDYETYAALLEVQEQARLEADFAAISALPRQTDDEG